MSDTPLCGVEGCTLFHGEARRLCLSTHQSMRCVLDMDHGGAEHESASGVKWPMHLPVVSEEERLAEIDRNARAYGWEIGRGRPMAEVVEFTEENPFLNPHWRKEAGLDE